MHQQVNESHYDNLVYIICHGKLQNSMSSFNLEKIRGRTHNVHGYLEEVSDENPVFKQKHEEYIIEEKIIKKLTEYANSTVVIAFSAEWCKDCHKNIPALDHISEATGIEIRIFGHLMRDAKDSKKRWRIPPSPVEVEEFDVIKIPHIVLLNQSGEIMGEIIENPPEGTSLEKAMLDLLER